MLALEVCVNKTTFILDPERALVFLPTSPKEEGQHSTLLSSEDQMTFMKIDVLTAKHANEIREMNMAQEMDDSLQVLHIFLGNLS